MPSTSICISFSAFHFASEWVSCLCAPLPFSTHFPVPFRDTIFGGRTRGRIDFIIPVSDCISFCHHSHPLMLLFVISLVHFLFAHSRFVSRIYITLSFIPCLYCDSEPLEQVRRASAYSSPIKHCLNDSRFLYSYDSARQTNTWNKQPQPPYIDVAGAE